MAAREVALESRRFVGSSLLLLALLTLGVFAIRRYGRGHRRLGGLLMVGVVTVIWSHASLDEARPVAAKFVAELTASSEHSHWQMVDDDVVAKRQLTFSLALAVAAGLFVLAVGPIQRLRRRRGPTSDSVGPDMNLRML